MATKHDKVPLVAPILARTLDLTVGEARVDTDRLGTFTGEIPRIAIPVEVAMAKARMGMAHAGIALGIASEGSIGPTPGAPFLVSDTELVVLVDDEAGTVVVGAEQGFDIMTYAAVVSPRDDLAPHARRADLPRHQLIVRPAEGPAVPLFKGIHAPDELRSAVRDAAAASMDGRARIETDPRADRCPSRRAIIARAAAKLAQRLDRRCARCATPGFGPVRAELGLPCAWCGTQVEVLAAEVWGCPLCPYERRVPSGADRAEPGSCPDCNP